MNKYEKHTTEEASYSFFLVGETAYFCKFKQVGNWISQLGKTFWAELLYKKTFPLDGQTRWTKLYSQPVKLHGARP